MIQMLEDHLAGKRSFEELTTLISIQLPLREASDFLVVLENGEADHLKKVSELLQKVLKVTVDVAEALLKAVIGSLG
jgi:hypothetical protein